MEDTVKTEKRGFWNFIDNIKGDKVVWIIVFMLIMISILAVFSSTSLLALQAKTDRLAIIKEQIITAAGGLAVIWAFCRIKRIGVFMMLSQLGFIASFALLALLLMEVDFGEMFKAVKINGVYRALRIFKLQIHVYEFVKVAMVMYLAWALHSFKKDQEDISLTGESSTFAFVNALSKTKNFEFLARPVWKMAIYMYIPIGIICLMIMPGSNSSAIFVGGILVATLLVGGVQMRKILMLAVLGVGLLAGVVGMHLLSGGKAIKRVGTFLSRIEADYSAEQLEKVPAKSAEFYDILDEIKQPYSAKVAVHEGGILGKGSGNSTQKYVVAVMYGDYMYSFIIEEYGLWGAIFVIILYVSLLARGSMIARLCENEFAKIAVGGLSVLITGQAFMHMFVNVDIGPMTGQTLPLISHGSSAFLMFSAAFGVILSISRMAREKIREEEEAAEPIYEKKDEIQATLEDLEQLDNFE